MDHDVDALIQDLAASDAAARSGAAERLARLGGKARPAAAPLARACGDASEEVRDWAVAALEELGPPPPEQVAGLIGLLASDNLDVGYWAVTLLGRAGPEAADAVPALAEVVDGGRPAELRGRAAWALGKVGPAAAAAVAALRAAARADDPAIARLAERAIGQIES